MNHSIMELAVQKAQRAKKKRMRKRGVALLSVLNMLLTLN